MKLYEVIRWGNDSDDPLTGGSNGPDTCFLVRAGSVEEAVGLVDPMLSRESGGEVRSFASAVYLLGTDSSAQEQPRVLRGPYIENAYRHGWRHWYREEPGDPWVEQGGE